MKFINIDNNIITVEFNADELNMISQTLNVPLHAFGLKDFLLKINTPKEKIEILNKKIGVLAEKTEKLVKLDFSMDEVMVLEKSFKAACDIADPIEIHTLTGYTWEDALKIQNGLRGVISQLHKR